MIPEGVLRLLAVSWLSPTDIQGRCAGAKRRGEDLWRPQLWVTWLVKGNSVSKGSLGVFLSLVFTWKLSR
jgi:hypothetical protein